MNLGLTGSFLIGGILLITILTVHMNVREDATTTTLQITAMTNATTVAEIADNDFPNIGVGNGMTSLLSASATGITFLSDIDGDFTIDTLTWHFDSTSADTATPNPNDHRLLRIVNSDTLKFSSNVTAFDLTYFDDFGSITANLDSIRRIRVRVLCESPAQFGTEFQSSAWQRTYVPINLAPLIGGV